VQVNWGEGDEIANLEGANVGVVSMSRKSSQNFWLCGLTLVNTSQHFWVEENPLIHLLCSRYGMLR